MAEVSKDFIHRKIKDDLWPSIERSAFFSCFRDDVSEFSFLTFV